MEQDAKALIERGVRAYRAGDTATARKLLSQAVKLEKRSETAWWYLAQAMDDTEKRGYCLQMVLKLNPNHAEAQAALMQGEAWQPTPPSGRARTGEAPKVNATPAGTTGVPIPPGIPGAPARYAPADLLPFVQALAQDSVKVISGQPTATEAEATWWRFYLTVAVTGFLAGLVANLGGVILLARGFGLNLWSLVSTPFLSALLSVLAVGAAAYGTHWYAVNRGGRAALLDHSLRLAAVWVPGALAMAVIGVVAALIGGGVVTLPTILRVGPPGVLSSGSTLLTTGVAAAVAGYSAYLLSKAFGALYPMLNSRDGWVMALAALTLIALML